MKLCLARGLIVLTFAVLWSGVLLGQETGQTQNIQVRRVTEPWMATVTNTSAALGSHTLIPAPTHWPKAPPAAGTTVTHSSAETQATSTPQSSASQVGLVFSGPSDGVPPDSQVAAGPNHLVSVVNSIIVIYSKSGTMLSSSGENAFFQSVGNCGCFDSRVLYDQSDQRFILSTSKKDSSSAVLLAVSQTSDPTGNWNKFEIGPSTTSWYDMPTLGLSSSALYISANLIPNSGPGAHLDLLVIGLPELLAGSSTLNITRFQNIASTGSITGAISYGSSPTEFLLETAGGGTILHMFKVNTGGAPALSKTDITVPFYRQPPAFASQPGDNTHLITGSNDIESVVWRNNSLWCAHAVASDDGTTAVVRWYEIDTTTETVKQSGTVSGAGNAFYPAITVLPDGEATVVYTTSSSTQFASAGYAHRNASDQPGTMPVSGIYQDGTVTYSIPRWGDYSGISPDPDGNSVWGIAEIARTSNTTTTAIGQIMATQPPNSPDFTLSASPGSATVKQGQSASYTITVGSQNGFQGTVALNCADLPANTTCSFNPAAVSVNGATSQAQLTIVTTAPKVSLGQRSIIFYAVMLPLATLLWSGLRQRRVARVLIVAFVLALAMGFHTGCAGSGTHATAPNPTPMPTPSPTPPPGSSGGTPLGAHTITVVGASGSLEHSIPVQLIVQ